MISSSPFVLLNFPFVYTLLLSKSIDTHDTKTHIQWGMKPTRVPAQWTIQTRKTSALYTTPCMYIVQYCDISCNAIKPTRESAPCVPTSALGESNGNKTENLSHYGGAVACGGVNTVDVYFCHSYAKSYIQYSCGIGVGVCINRKNRNIWIEISMWECVNARHTKNTHTCARDEIL